MIDESIFGSGNVADAFNQFYSNWSDKRTELTNDLSAAVSALRSIAENYDTVESDLVKAAQQSG